MYLYIIGGTYGYVRGILGLYIGFFVGTMEIVVGAATIASYLMAAGEAITLAFGLRWEVQCAVWVIFLTVATYTQVTSNERFRWIAGAGVLVSLLFLFIYIVGSYSRIDPGKYSDNYFHEMTDYGNPRLSTAFSCITFPEFFFEGIELLPVLAHKAEKPNEAIPRGLLLNWLFSTIVAFLVVYVSTYQYPGPGVLSNEPLPLRFGFASIFQVPPHMGGLFSLPMAFTSLICGLYCINRVAKSMAESGLLPSFFKQNSSTGEITWTSAVSISGLLLGPTIIGVVVLNYLPIYFFNICTFLVFVLYSIYAAIFVTYIVLSQHFHRIPRPFRNPFGSYSAYLGLLIFGFMSVAQLFWPHAFYVTIFFVVYILGFTVLYRQLVRYFETYSEEEGNVFFLALIIKGESVIVIISVLISLTHLLS
jgi:amino acid transporter